MFRTNVRPEVSTLDSLLTEGNSGDSAEAVYKTKVDVSLRTPGSGPPSILLLLFPEIGKPAITMNIEIGPNGRINIPDSSGIWENITGDPHDRPNGEEVEKLHALIAQSLEMSEDLGIFIQWTLQWIKDRRKARSGKV